MGLKPSTLLRAALTRTWRDSVQKRFTITKNSVFGRCPVGHRHSASKFVPEQPLRVDELYSSRKNGPRPRVCGGRGSNRVQARRELRVFQGEEARGLHKQRDLRQPHQQLHFRIVFLPHQGSVHHRLPARAPGHREFHIDFGGCLVQCDEPPRSKNTETQVQRDRATRAPRPRLSLFGRPPVPLTWPQLLRRGDGDGQLQRHDRSEKI